MTLPSITLFGTYRGFVTDDVPGAPLRVMPIVVSVEQDGDQASAMVGPNLAEGVAGFGYTIAEAISKLVKEIQDAR